MYEIPRCPLAFRVLFFLTSPLYQNALEVGVLRWNLLMHWNHLKALWDLPPCPVHYPGIPPCAEVHFQLNSTTLPLSAFRAERAPL